MKLIKEIALNDFIFTRIEYLHHTRTSYLFIINEIIKKRSEYEYNKELLDYYMEKYIEVDTEFRLTSQELVIKYFGEEYTKEKYSSEFNFIYRVMRIYEEEVDENKRQRRVSRFNCQNNGKL